MPRGETAETLTRSLKNAQQEVQAWDHRLEKAKSDVTRLTKEAETLQNAIDKKVEASTLECADRDRRSREMARKVAEQELVLKQKGEELVKLEQELNRQRLTFDQQKSELEIEKQTVAKKKQKAVDFIVTIQRAATQLG